MQKDNNYCSQFIEGLSISREARNLFRKILFNYLGKRTPPLAKKKIVTELQSKLRTINIDGNIMEIIYSEKRASLSISPWKDGFPDLLKSGSAPRVFQLKLTDQAIILAVVYTHPNTSPSLKTWVSINNTSPCYSKDVFGWQELEKERGIN